MITKDNFSSLSVNVIYTGQKKTQKYMDKSKHNWKQKK